MIDLIYCADGNPRLSQIAREEGWYLGFRSDGSFSLGKPLFIDIDYKHPNFERHLDVIAKYRPRYATVPDLSESETTVQDIERAMQQVARIQKYCDIPLVVPKRAEQLAILPVDVAIGYSIPSSYGGAQFSIWEVAEYLQNRRIHLLGGSPRKQMQAYLQLSPFAHVGSADGNYAQRQAIKYAMYWQRHSWHYHPCKGSNGKDLYFECWRWSCRNLMQAWQKLQREKAA